MNNGFRVIVSSKNISTQFNIQVHGYSINIFGRYIKTNSAHYNWINTVINPLVTENLNTKIHHYVRS
jgi:hypothetical protein